MHGRHHKGFWIGRLRWSWPWVAVWAATILAVGGVAYAVSPNTIGCGPGVSIEVKPDGTWACMAAAPTPSGSPSATASPSPSPTVTPSPSPTVTPSPSSSPTPSPTPTATTPPTTTPPPTTTTPPQPTNNCYTQLAACGLPHAGNTGPHGTLTAATGQVTLFGNGAIYENRDLNGCITVTGQNVIIRNVRIRGNCFWGIQNQSIGLTIQDSWISCGSTNGTGIGSSSFTALRVRVSDCENGFNISGNATVRDSYIADLEAGGGAHTDGAQFNQGASNITFEHNTMLTPSPGGTAAIIMWDEGNPQNGNVRIAGNLLGGGTYTLYCARQGPVNNVRILNNRFIGGVKVAGDWVKDPGGAEFGMSNGCTGDHVTQFSGNVRDLNGNPIGQE